MNIKEEHYELIARLKKEGKDPSGFPLAKYLGTAHTVYNVPVPEMQKIAKGWAKDHQTISRDELVSFVDTLFHGDSREEKIIASLILGKFPQYLNELESFCLDRWMGRLTGWEEVDSFCDEVDVWLRADATKRVSLLKKWNKDKQIEKRRASLVVLCSSVRHNPGEFFVDLALQCIDTLKSESHVMITKAISWLLRSLIKYHKEEVARYLKETSSTLPRIAVREVTRKLETGKK